MVGAYVALDRPSLAMMALGATVAEPCQGLRAERLTGTIGAPRRLVFA